MDRSWWRSRFRRQIDLLMEARALDLVDVLLDLDHPRVVAQLPELIQGIEDQVRALSRRSRLGASSAMKERPC